VIAPILALVALLLLPSLGGAQLLQVMPLFEPRCAQSHGGSAAALGPT
jgi:hypothetical protein